MLASGPQQDRAQLTYRMVHQLHIAEQLTAGVVVAGDVPPVQGVLVAQVRDELRDRHLPPGPRNHGIGLALQDSVQGAPHPLLLGIQPPQ